MLSINTFRRRASDLKVLFSRQVHKSYYDALGLTPKASQGDIKRAYYEKSMVYHPDKWEGNPEAFKEICTAYEVLGNNKLRKMYDKGLLPVGAAGYAAVKEKSKSQSEEAREDVRKRKENLYENMNATSFDESHRKKKTYTGKTDQFDYDAWTEAHYHETFTRQESGKAEFERLKRQREEAALAVHKLDRIFSISAIIMWVGFMLYFRDIYDLQFDKPARRRPPES
ncbi:DnaJ subfamily A member 1 [Orchesella cincta]|uniref:DnaJ subfamily A member 1 n=1 Tax=Orchesella cincta TaxID=48709 RepID=A0A1D2NI98_ORCCI|nr:DnaJ subfamily A member 1 [Orchesella cincta]